MVNMDQEPPVHTLEAKDVSKDFPVRRGLFKKSSLTVITNADLAVRSSEVVGLVGESGSGKTTLARILAGLLPPTAGDVFLDGASIHSRNGGARLQARKRIRFMFQKINAPLNPRMRIGNTLMEPLEIHTTMTKHERVRRVLDVCAEVRLPMHLLYELPRALSGGEKRRVGLARALMVRPWFIIADEPTAGLDADLRAGFLELIKKLSEAERIGIVVVSHDIGMVKSICSEIHEIKNARVDYAAS